ncbi:hypothetical protein PG993_008417 [Apiospora rasikravindrae]|uniref:Uncharacterized protein n=1 Tax=Apiospora rasikravindrae TaxID=990691 RepID=A0ABR1T0A4_9PEZI
MKNNNNNNNNQGPSGSGDNNPDLMDQIGDRARQLVQLALTRPVGTAPVPGTNGNLLYGTSSLGGVDATMLYHWSDMNSQPSGPANVDPESMEQIGDRAKRLMEQGRLRAAATTAVPGTSGNLSVGTSSVGSINSMLLQHWSAINSAPAASNPAVRPPMWQMANWMHLCYFTEALYTSSGIQWSYGEPQRVAVPPSNPNSRFRLTIEARTNLCSPTWGKRWPEMDACSAAGVLHAGNEVLLAQIQVVFVLSKVPGADDANITVDPWQLQRENAARQLEKLEPQSAYLPLLYFDPANPATGAPHRAACSNMVDHRHMGEALAFPEVLWADIGYLAESHAPAAAGQLLADSQETMRQEQAQGRQPGDGFINAVQWKLREALRWGARGRVARAAAGGGRGRVPGRAAVRAAREGLGGCGGAAGRGAVYDGGDFGADAASAAGDGV